MDFKSKVKQMVGQPIPESMLENIDWNRYSVLEAPERDRQLSQLAESIRNRVNGTPNGEMLLS